MEIAISSRLSPRRRHPRPPQCPARMGSLKSVCTAAPACRSPDSQSGGFLAPRRPSSETVLVTAQARRFPHSVAPCVPGLRLHFSPQVHGHLLLAPLQLAHTSVCHVHCVRRHSFFHTRFPFPR